MKKMGKFSRMKYKWNINLLVLNISYIFSYNFSYNFLVIISVISLWISLV